MPADRLFGPTFTTAAMAAIVSDAAWLRAMLDFEAALARAEARVGMIPPAAAQAIADACATPDLDIEAIGRQAAASGTPVVPLLEALRARLPAGAAAHLHRGATSQDVLDTAMMLLARDGLELLAAELAAVAAATAALVRLAQNEVGEATEPGGEGRGVSSAMPHKRNPAASVAALACARGVQAQAGILLGAMVQAHERAAGEWQSEWPAVSEALRLSAGAVGRMRAVMEGLEVHPERMRSNLEAAGERLSGEAARAMAQRAAEALIAGTLAAYESRRRG